MSKGSTTVIKQSLTVDGLLPAATSKYGRGAVKTVVNGRTEFLGLNEGVDESAIEEGKEYTFEIAVSKTGKRYINAVLGEAEGEPAKPAKRASKSKNAVPASEELTVNERIVRQNIGNVAAVLSTGDPSGFVSAYDLVKAKYQEEGLI